MNIVQPPPPTVEAVVVPSPGAATTSTATAAVTAAPYVPRARIIAAPGGSIAGRRDYEERTSSSSTGTNRRRRSRSSLTRPSCSPSLPRVASLTTPINKTMGDIDLSSSSKSAAAASSSPSPEPVISHPSAVVMDDRAHTLRNAARAAAGLPPVDQSTPQFVPYTGLTTATTTSPSPTLHPAITHGTSNNTTKIQDNKKAAMRDLVRTIHPTEYVRAAFTANGFPVAPHQAEMIAACTRRLVAHTKPTAQQLHEYHDPDAHLVQVIRTNNVKQARHLYHAGKLTVNACNPFGESILHLACRRGLYDMVQFLVEEVGIALETHRDDYHRTVLHDVLWSASDFDTTANLVKYLLLTCASTAALLLVEDVRGYTPFDYARAEHRGKWLHFLWEHRTWLWPPPPDVEDDDDAPTTETPTNPTTEIATRTAATAVPTPPPLPVHQFATAALAAIETKKAQPQLPPATTTVATAAATATTTTVATAAGTAAAVAAASSTILFPRNQPYRSTTEEEDEDEESASSEEEDEEDSSAESQSEEEENDDVLLVRP